MSTITIIGAGPDVGGVMEHFKTLQQEWKIKAVGISNAKIGP